MDSCHPTEDVNGHGVSSLSQYHDTMAAVPGMTISGSPDLV